jgi:hypothetical protein
MQPKCIENTLSRSFRIGRLTDVDYPNKARTVVRFHKTLHNVPHLIERAVPLNEKSTLSADSAVKNEVVTARGTCDQSQMRPNSTTTVYPRPRSHETRRG